MTAPFKRAQTYIPQGSFTLSKRPGAFPSDGMPHLAWRGDGPYVVDVANGKYLDWICALGALTVGHNHPHVVEAVIKQVRDGAIFSLPSILEGRVAERLCGVIPCAQQVKVVKTGSEACAAAVRIARAATGRNLIVKFNDHYHGWHDWSMVTAPKHPGVPDTLSTDIISLGSDFDWVVFDLSTAKPAAFIFEPERLLLDGVNLAALVELCRAHDVLVIFDETLSGGRLAVGGVQEMTGIVPDLAVFGKAFGGGYPFAFVCGREDLMAHAWPVSGTFSGDAIGLAAADAMLDVYRDEGVIARLWEIGRKVQASLSATAASHKLPIKIQGFAPRFWIKEIGEDRRKAMSVFVQQCAAWHVLVHQAVFFANAAMDDKQVDDSIDAFQHALGEVAVGVHLRGEPYQDSVR